MSYRSRPIVQIGRHPAHCSELQDPVSLVEAMETHMKRTVQGFCEFGGLMPKVDVV